MARVRERWGSKIGIILAVAGSAVGLGNFLRFPGLGIAIWAFQFCSARSK